MKNGNPRAAALERKVGDLDNQVKRVEKDVWMMDERAKNEAVEWAKVAFDQAMKVNSIELLFSNTFDFSHLSNLIITLIINY